MLERHQRAACGLGKIVFETYGSPSSCLSLSLPEYFVIKFSFLDASPFALQTKHEGDMAVEIVCCTNTGGKPYSHRPTSWNTKKYGRVWI